MNLDDFKEPWQKRQRDLDGRVDHVIKKVRSRMSGFDKSIWWRDMRESLAAIVLIVWYGYSLLQPQNWWGKCGFVLGIVACIYIIVVFNWARVKGKVARTDLPMEDYCKAELVRVDRQIWMLRNIHLTYLGPLAIALAAQIAAIRPDLTGLIMFSTMLMPLFGFIYWLNQIAVKAQLLPLREELTRAIDGDDVDSDIEAIADHGASVPQEPFKVKRRDMIIAIIAMLAVMIAGGLLTDMVDAHNDAAKVSPFTEVQFEAQKIIVTYEGQNYEWLELDGIKVEDIVAAAQKRFLGRWQKRVSEDLVDVLWGMDHQPGETVSLLLRDLATNDQRVIEQASMTTDNRFAVYQNRINDEFEANANRNNDELSGEQLEDLSIDQALRDRLVGRYQLAPDFIFDVQDHDGHLMVGITNQETQEVFPDSATRWSYQTVEAMLEFKLGPDGPAKRVILHQNDFRQSATRINE